MHLEIQRNQQYTFEWSFFDKNIKEVPVEGTISIYKPGSSTDTIVDNQAVSIETDGTIKYTLSSSLTDTLDKNYKIELAYQVGDVVKRPFYLFTIVETPLQNTVRDEDLFQHIPELRDKMSTNVVETTTAGTTTSFISKELRYLNLDVKGGICEIYIDDTTQHNAEIQTWDKETFTATFYPAYTSAIPNCVKVAIRASFQRYINDAYDNFVYRDIRNRVPLAAGYIDSTVIDNLTVFKALDMICFGRVEETDDKWHIRSKMFKEMYGKEFVKLNEAYDYNEDGDINPVENENKPNLFNRGLRR
jgi:hypothetical protein